MADLVKDCSQILSGPADVALAGDALGHTQGGTSVKYEPKNRPVVVDQYGETPCKFVHVGDDLRVMTSFAQWAAAVLKACVPSGHDNSGGSPGNIGIGRSAGYIYTTQILTVEPLLSADAARLVTLHKAHAVGGFELAFKPDEDRIFNVEFVGNLDATKTDGAIVGSLGLTAAT